MLKLKITICGDTNSVRILMNHFNPNLRKNTNYLGFLFATKFVRVEKFNAKFIIWNIESSRIFGMSGLFSGSLG